MKASRVARRTTTINQALTPTTKDTLSRPGTVPQDVHIPPEIWAQTFSGALPNEEPPTICLEKDHLPGQYTQTTFDIDSFMGYSSDLSFARDSIKVQPVPLAHQNIANNLHFHRPEHAGEEDEDDDIDTYSRSTTKQLSHIAHFYFGRTAEDISIYLVFPRTKVSSQGFISLTRLEFALFWDEVFYPSLRAVVPDNVYSHWPGGYEHGLRNSLANQETRSRPREAPTAQRVAYPLPARHLTALWQ
ncbi:hypothetical protein LTR66_013016 [Elasticomyces elasticus]|nr:hypothetical protein LTR66_013016 [Elasticomyces elasticus]